MDGRDLVRSVKAIGVAGPARGLRLVRAAWNRRRSDVVGLSARGRELARAPGAVVGAEPGPGGGVLRFARSELRIMVTSGGALFWSWDGAGPLPSYALGEQAPEVDPRAVLEPDKDGGWRVVAERFTLVVSRLGAIEVHTPGGVLLRRDQPPRWWERSEGDGGRWVQRSEVAADARFFGLGGAARGPRLRDGTYRLWNSAAGDGAWALTMPVRMVVADAGTHLVFHDTTWDGTVTVAEGEVGAGSGHDRPGTCELRVSGGPLRCWVIVGPPARVLTAWASLTGAPGLPPTWALGHHHVRGGSDGEREVRWAVESHRAKGLSLAAVHLDPGQAGEGRAFADGLPELVQELDATGVRLVSGVGPGVGTGRGEAAFETGTAAGFFVRDARGRVVRGEARAGEVVYPDFTDPRARAWWGVSYQERLKRGFAGFWHGADRPGALAPGGEPVLPRSARQDLDGAGGDHRAGHNVYGLGMARAAHEGLTGLRPRERPFLLTRSGWAGVQRYAGVWCGPVERGWAGPREALSQVLGLGLCGVPFAGPDVGADAADVSGELFVRTLQLAAYLPLLRTRGPLGPGGREPWEFGEEVLAHARAALDGRSRLLPYFTTLAHLARRSGAPYVRPVWWGSAGDRALRDCEDVFLLGDCLLVAPVLAEDVVERTVLLPRGRWYDTFTERAYEGPGKVAVKAPLSRIPVLARAGAVLPVRGAGGVTELEVWAPAHGRTGGGALVEDAGDGWTVPEVERYVTRRGGKRVVVAREGDDGPREAGRPVRVRGL